jgi:hypothetical protein
VEILYLPRCGNWWCRRGSALGRITRSIELIPASRTVTVASAEADQPVVDIAHAGQYVCGLGEQIGARLG